ncbi:sulfatase-like hydrolase/transferase [Rubrimonas sp.]|uniref:sulfatase-like hydrolase/transferase n=1 Tax=Rubrimonas sp. TaxID=2036015 RepID=UPI002FDDF839
MTRPAPGNVLFVTLDQLRADVLRGALAAFCPTPNLDRLAAQSAVFTQHFAAAVPCGPSRASLLTGLHAFNHRSIRNGTPLARHHATVATEARKLGHEPLLFGYTDATPDPTGMHTADPDLESYEGVAPGFRELVEMRFDTGFEWLGWLKRLGYPTPRPLPARIMDIYRPDGEGIDAPALYRAEHSDSAYLTDRVLEALDIRTDRPWFAHVAYLRPHPPLVAPAPWNRLVDPAALPAPAVARDAHPFRAAWASAPTAFSLFHGFDGDCAALTSAQIATLRAVYLGLAAEVDHHVGRLLDWLEATGQVDETLVIVTADHGEMLGDQGMWGKESVLAPAHHVPLILRDPRRPGARRIDALTSGVDLAPTMLDWLGGTPPPAMDGRSLLSFPDDAAPAAWRDAVLTELDLSDPRAPTRFQTAWGLAETRCNAAVLRSAEWTYVHFNGGVPPMLFDRRADPDETRDLAPDPARRGTLLAMAQAMLDLRMTRADRRLTGYAIGV